MTKTELYADVAKQISAVIDGETYETARYATAVCLLSETFDYYFWTGFYVVDPLKPTELVVSAYQGTLACLRIPFTRGVCGACASTGKTIVVEDVHAFEGHIACDVRSNSEIVVPVFNTQGDLAAVLDVDSTQVGAFDEEDKAGLEAICKMLLV